MEATAEPGAGLREEVDIEDMAAAAGNGTTPKNAADVTLDSPDLPDDLRGKTAKELADLVASTRDAVRISESARLAAEATASAWNAADRARSSTTQVQRETPSEDPLDKITDEQVDQLLASEEPGDRVRGTRLMVAKAEKRALAQAEARFGNMAQSNAESAMNAAKIAFPAEFELFGEEILGVASKMPASSLSSAGNWKMLIETIRGREGNIDKYIDHRASKRARDLQKEDAPFTPRSGASPTNAARSEEPRGGSSGLDETQKKIALKQFPAKTEAESFATYKKWMNV